MACDGFISQPSGECELGSRTPSATQVRDLASGQPNYLLSIIISYLDEKNGENHDDDQTGDCRSCDRGTADYALCRASKETQASQAQHIDSTILWGFGNVESTIGNLRYVRAFNRNCYRPVNRILQLAFGRSDK
jgi:hypothetical protein